MEIDILKTVISKGKLIKMLIEFGSIQPYYGFKIVKHKNPTHGSCCNCQKCGYDYDNCICEHNELIELIIKL